MDSKHTKHTNIAMKTLLCAPNATLNISKPSPWKPNFLAYHPIQKLNHPFTTLNPHASAKGFSSTGPPSSDDFNKKPIRGKNNNDDDELPKSVMDRLIGRILFSVGVPMGLGLGFMHLFGVLKETKVWDGPPWIQFLTIFVTFGTSSIGIAYGALSTSLDAKEEGSFLGVEQIQKNWVEMWQEEQEDAS